MVIKMSQIQLIELFFALLIFVFIGMFLIKKKTNPSFSLFWLFLAVFALVIAIFPQAMDFICGLIGIDYPPTLILVIAVVVLLFVAFWITSEVSILENKVRELSIHVSLLNDEMRLLKQELNKKWNVEEEDEKGIYSHQLSK